MSQHSIEFDLVGVDASIANAFRRIMIAEVTCFLSFKPTRIPNSPLQVPTICIENVFIWNNTSVLDDEILAHRIGLVPLNVDPSQIEMRGPTDQPTDRNTLIFNIQHECTRNPKAPNGSTDPNELYFNWELRSSHITWEPAGLQPEVFATTPAPTNKDIVLVKLRPGQQVHVELHAVKGVGKDHAKFSPVGGWFPAISKIYLLRILQLLPRIVCFLILKLLSRYLRILPKNSRNVFLLVLSRSTPRRKQSASTRIVRGKI